MVAVVVIGIEPGWTKRVVDGIAATGKPVVGFSIEQNGDLKTIMDASRAAKDMVHFASELQREECSIADLWISTKCGESDTTTGLGSCPTVGQPSDRSSLPRLIKHLHQLFLAQQDLASRSFVRVPHPPSLGADELLLSGLESLPTEPQVPLD